MDQTLTQLIQEIINLNQASQGLRLRIVELEKELKRPDSGQKEGD